MNTIFASFFVCSLSLLGIHEAKRVPIAHVNGWFNCSIQNDTITIITQQKEMLLCQVIVADSTIRKNSLTAQGFERWGEPEIVSTPTSLGCLYRENTVLNPHARTFFTEQRNGDTGYTVDTKIPASCIPQFLIPWDSGYLVLFGDYVKRFTVSPDGMAAEYGPLAYRTVRNGVVGDMRRIESGRTCSPYNLYTIVMRDTLYAVWHRTVHKSFLAMVTDARSSLVFARYDGSSWSTPQPFYDCDREGDVSLLGLYQLHDQLYCFLQERLPDGKRDRILFMQADTSRHWTAPVELTRCAGFLYDWLACTDEADRLHIVIHDSKKDGLAYATFDGATFEPKYDLNVDLTSISPKRLQVDNGQPYLFYRKDLKTTTGDTASDAGNRINQTLVDENGKNVSVTVLKPPSEAEPEETNSFELYILPL